MGRGKKPKKSYKLTLHFDTKIGIDNFKAWYIDGGGDQIFNYDVNSWGKDWMHLTSMGEACTKCEFYDDALQDRAFQNKSHKRIMATCVNCANTFSFENPYYDKKS